MGLFDKLFAKKEVATPSYKELRVHSRFNLYEDRHFGFDLGQEVVPFINFSYGGFSVANEYVPLLESGSASLCIFDEQCAAKFSKIYDNGTTTGFSFRHDTPDLLLFLRSKIEYLRMGSSARLLSRSIMKEPYNQDGWYCYRGEGPCDIHFKDASEGLDGLMVFLVEGPYAQIQFSNHTVKTGYTETTSSGQIYSVIRETQKPVEELLRYGHLILTGLMECKEKELIRKYRDLLEKEISKSQTAA